MTSDLMLATGDLWRAVGFCRHDRSTSRACLTAEVESRRQSRFLARFPALKTLESFDFPALPDLPKARVLQLADARFVKARENVICLGPTGTGKTHTAIALGVAAIHAGCRVRFTTAVALGQELLQANTEARLPKALKTWDRFDLVILDELGYLGLGPAGPLLFQFCAHRYERGSLLITTNLEFSRWVEVFGDATLSSPCSTGSPIGPTCCCSTASPTGSAKASSACGRRESPPEEPLNPTPGWSVTPVNFSISKHTR